MRWKKRPEGSNWGDFGPNDQLGRLNWLDAEKVKQGIAEVKEGITFSLSLPLDYPGGNSLNERRHPPELAPTEKNGLFYTNFPMRLITPRMVDVLSDDKVTLSLQYSTQWDSFAHVGAFFDANDDGVPERVYYNGYSAKEHIEALMDFDEEGKITLTGKKQPKAKALDITNQARHGIQGRAVMVDLAKHYGDEPKSVTYQDLKSILNSDNIVIEKGDILVLHTGFAQRVLEMNKSPDPKKLHNMCATLDGSDDDLLQWITDSGIVAIAADNYSVETYPNDKPNSCCANLPIHHHCLFKLGIPLGELWHLTPLAEWLQKNNRNRFLLTAPPLNLPGAVGSPVTPIATV